MGNALRATGRRYLPGLAALSLLAGCEEPVFTEDARVEAATDAAAPDLDGSNSPLASPCDGGACCDGATCSNILTVTTPADGGPRDPRERWEGRYATRSEFYALDGLIESRSELLTLVDIKRQGDGLVMEQQFCHFDGGWAFLLQAQLRFDYPTNAVLRMPLHFDDDSFESELALLNLGFGEQPSECNGATTATPSPGQKWSGASCTCGVPDALPTSLSDCRLNDIDNDNQPGVTLTAAVSGGRWLYYVAQQTSIRHVNGYRRGDRLYAKFETQDKNAVLGCGADALPGCPVGAAKVCPANYNVTEFVRLDEEFDCQRLKDQEAGLFLLSPQPYPAACTTELKAQPSTP